MAKTFTNEPLGPGFRHSVKTERGHYIMGGSWIDCTNPRDMMDYDFTTTFADGIKAANEIHQLWCQGQIALSRGSL